ncbi:MAG TPA: hypothetical protein DEA08_03840 [Planctomycetes bacterium]|nr:hypothetical protein [Planctomycetota bacterium]
MPTAQDEAFLRLASARGLLRAEDASRVLQGLHVGEPAAQGVVRARLVPPQRAEEFQRSLGGLPFRCRRCGSERPYESLAQLTSLDCPSCGAPRGLAPPGDSGPLVRPAHPGSEPGRSAGSAPGVAYGSEAGRSAGSAPGAPYGSAPGSAYPPRGSSASRPAVPSSGAFVLPKSASELKSSRSRKKRRRLGGYELRDELGRGNNGVVYLARRPGLERRFALKVLLGAANDEESRQRFELEAQIASKLDHPGIITVYDVGREGEHCYYVMEYCEGPTLADQIEAGPLEPRRAAEIVAQLGEALAVAHDRQVVHRDMKPANVIIDARSGRARITDFGLARDQELAESMTRTGDILGTPYYMAPEQLRGERPLDGRADVYALGVILYECLTGRRPYTAKSPFELAQRVFAGDCTTIGELEPEVPAPLESIQRRAMAVTKEERYASATELAVDLRAYLEGRTPLAHAGREAPAQPQQARRKRARWVPILVGASVLLALSVGVLAVSVVRSERRSQRLELLLAEARAEAPADLGRLEQALSEARELAPEGHEGVARLATWLEGWQSLRKAEQALAGERPDYVAAEAALGLARQATSAGPHLGEAVDRVAQQLRTNEALTRLERESREPRPLDEALVGRWEAVLARVSGRVRAAARRGLMDYLRRRLRARDFARQVQLIEEPAERRRARLTESLLHTTRGDREAAAQVLRSLLSEAEGDEVVVLAAGALQDLSGHPSREQATAAIARLEEAIAREPDLEVLSFARLCCLGQVSRPQDALAGLRELHDQEPDDAMVASWLLRLLVVVRRHEQADQLGTRLRGLLGARIPAGLYPLMSIVQLELKRPAAALEWLERGLRAFPDSLEILLFQGLALQRAKRRDEGIAVWRRAYQRDPARFEQVARDYLPQGVEGVLAAARGEADRAQASDLDLSTVSERAQELLEARVRAVAEASRPALQRVLEAAASGAAWVELEPLLKALPPDAQGPLAIERAQVLVGYDRFAEAEQALAALAKDDAPLQAEWLRVDLDLRRGRRDEAIRGMEALIKRDPEGRWGATARARLYLIEGRYALAAKGAQIMLGRASEDARAHVFLARALYSQGQVAQALEAILRAHYLAGASDTRIAAVYALIKSGEVLSRQARGAGRRSDFPHLQRITEQLFAMTSAAWPRLLLAEQMLGTGISNGYVLRWVSKRLSEAEAAEPERHETHLLWGLFHLYSRAGREKVLASWRKAKELGAKPSLLRTVGKLYERTFGGRDEAFEELLR